jgi:pyruvate-ferredoxin/flavodoxin oxidoreductase
MYNETRYRMLVQSDEARAEMLLKQVTADNKKRLNFYRQMAAMHYNQSEDDSHG